MSLKLLVVTLLLAVLAGAAWLYRGEEPLKRYLPPGWQGSRAVPTVAAPPAPAEGLRKCRQGGKVLYTNGDCPKGSAEQPITGGAVTVVPGARPAEAPAEAGPPDLGKLMGKEAAGELRDKRIDRATSK
jgi:hypothetical protein